MKAVVYRGRERMALEEACRPSTGPQDVTIRINCAGLCGSDVLIYQGGLDARIAVPRIPGHEFSGVVEEAGAGSGLEPGQRVVVNPTMGCGQCVDCEMGGLNVCLRSQVVGVELDGGFAEYVKVPQRAVHDIPEGVTFEEAALAEPLGVAVHAVRRSGLEVGESVLVQGAGPIGLLLALVGRACGAGRVMLTEVNEFRAAAARQMGLEVVNPRSCDVRSTVAEQTKGRGVDVFFEVTGLADPVECGAVQMVRPRGRLVVVGMYKKPAPFDLALTTRREIAVLGSRNYTPHDFRTALALISGNQVDVRPLISKVRGLDRVTDTIQSVLRGEDVLKVLFSPAL